MKKIWLLLSFAAFSTTFTQIAHAEENLVFSSYQCDPISCNEEGVTGTNSSASVSFVGYCTGDIVPVLSFGASAAIENCSSFYTPIATVEVSKTEYLDDCGDPYYVSYETPFAEVLNLAGITVFSLSATYGCDGSESSPIRRRNQALLSRDFLFLTWRGQMRFTRSRRRGAADYPLFRRDSASATASVNNPATCTGRLRVEP
jgi:hypothetical protein